MPRLSFSQRMGLTPKEFPLQVDSLDDATRMDIWNAFYMAFASHLMNCLLVSSLDIKLRSFCETVWSDFFRLDISQLRESKRFLREVRSFITSKDRKWNEVFDLCEFIIQIPINQSKSFCDKLDMVLQRNNVAYRVIGTEISPITDEQEIQAIKIAMELPDQLAGARTHISTALQLLSDREKPDYRNSIKESISAVEAVCKVLANNEHATLPDAIKSLKKNGFTLHGGLEQGLLKIYGYTSDQGGIRHAMIEEGTVATQEDALFMLVSCSAFCHYLQQKGAQAGLLS